MGMNKIFSVILTALIALTVFTAAGCSKNNSTSEQPTDKADPLKLGLGVYTVASATDATEDKAGEGQFTVTAAAVLVDNDGKIVKAFIDCADNKVGYTADGKAVANDSFTTKHEAGKGYNMVAYGNAAKEWYEQADTLCSLIVGKNADEVKALIEADGKGTDEVINAGCTINVTEFAYAVDKAITNAVESSAVADDTLKLGVSTVQSTDDAAEDKLGYNKVETTLFAAAVNADGKVTAALSDCVEAEFKFDAVGASYFDSSEKILTKKELGDNYGMKAYGGSKKEWYEQAAAFDAACIGKNAGEITGLMADNGKGIAELQIAGCTVTVSGFVKAASKIG